MSIFYFPMDLQLFADGEAGADGGSVTGAAEKSAVAGRGEPKVLYGKQHAAGADHGDGSAAEPGFQRGILQDDQRRIQGSVRNPAAKESRQ